MTKAFTVTFRLICFVAMVIIAVRNWLVPLSHDEVATFFYYIQNGSFIPFNSHVDANGHFLTSATSWICYKLLGSSPFVMRLPNLAGFVFLCLGIAKLHRLLDSGPARWMPILLLLFNFFFIALFSLMRGYALSMSFLLLGFSFFISYRRYHMRGDLYLMLLFLQLGLSANLTLLIVSGLLSFLTILLDIVERVRPNIATILVWLIHFGLLCYWAAFAFYLQDQGALYYGGGSGYWEVTFRSLIDFLYPGGWVAYTIFIALFLLLAVAWIAKLRQGYKAILHSSFFITFTCFLLLVIGFWLMKVLLGINYPEDRTGLFFYIFLVLSITFMVDEFVRNPKNYFVPLPFVLMVIFVWMFTASHHPWSLYETMPRRFMARLESEVVKAKRPVTIAGHRVRELFYAFLNYKATHKTSQMTNPDSLQMNADFALATMKDKPWDSLYYDEIDVDHYSGFRLLKRRQPLVRTILAESNDITINGNQEFNNVYEISDSTFDTTLPLEAEFAFSVNSVPKPLNAWLVLQIDSDEGKILVRTPMNWLAPDWQGVQGFKTVLTTGNTPRRFKRLVAYIWNIDKKKIDMYVHYFTLRQISGDGVEVISKAKL